MCTRARSSGLTEIPHLRTTLYTLTASHLHCTAGSSRSLTAIRKDAGLCCGSRLRKGEVFSYVGLPQNLKNLKSATEDTCRPPDRSCSDGSRGLLSGSRTRSLFQTFSPAWWQVVRTRSVSSGMMTRKLTRLGSWEGTCVRQEEIE